MTTLQFLNALYPDLLWLGKLLIWTLTRRNGNRQSFWTSTLDEAADAAHRVKKTRDVFFTVALHDSAEALIIARRRFPKVKLPRVRASHDTAVALPAIWAELEPTGTGRDLSPNWPAVLAALEGYSRPPSIIVWTGTGYLVYWLFDRLWILDSDAKRNRAKDLLRRHQAAVRETVRTQGFRVKDTADLARSHRLPGTLFHPDSGPSEAVVVGHFPLAPGASEGRYRPSDFDDLPAAPRSRHRASESPLRIERIREGCRWLRHCEQDQDHLDEVEWLAALHAVGLMESSTRGRRGLAHDYSRGHPGYNSLKTEEMLAHAMRRREPLTCAGIERRFDPDGRFCGRCPYRGQIETPLDLGRDGAPKPLGVRDPEAERIAASSSTRTIPLIVVVFNTGPAADAEATGIEAAGTVRAGTVRADIERRQDGVAELGSRSGPVPDLIDGLAELLERLGGAATAREIVDELARSGDDFLALRAALEALIPQLQPGDLPRVIDLAGRLRAYRGRVVRGASIEQASKDYKGTHWMVRRAA